MTPMEKDTSSKQATDEISIDSSHELYLHHSDHPNCSLASKALDGDNYGHWKRAVEVSLVANNKLGFVNGTTKKPDDDSPHLEQ